MEYFMKLYISKYLIRQHQLYFDNDIELSLLNTSIIHRRSGLFE